jgi:predicted PurR-regulated permease PerM
VVFVILFSIWLLLSLSLLLFWTMMATVWWSVVTCRLARTRGWHSLTDFVAGVAVVVIVAMVVVVVVTILVVVEISPKHDELSNQIQNFVSYDSLEFVSLVFQRTKGHKGLPVGSLERTGTQVGRQTGRQADRHTNMIIV